MKNYYITWNDKDGKSYYDLFRAENWNDLIKQSSYIIKNGGYITDIEIPID